MPAANSLLSYAGIKAPRRALSRWPNLLRWQQWLLLFAMGALVIMFEVRSHALMWQEHQSGQTIWTDLELIQEILLFGLILPVLGGVGLGYLGRTAAERDVMARELAMRRALVRQMHEAQQWSELADLIVTTPAAVVSAERAWLLAQRSREEGFDLVASWEHPSSALSLSSPLLTPAVCESCAEPASQQGNRLVTCRRPELGGGSWQGTRYCLWLSHDSTGKAALLFDLLSDRALDSGKMKVMEDLGDEMSLAIDRTKLHYIDQRQGEVARSERLRIARGLHDTLGQNLSYLRLKLEQLSAAEPAVGRTGSHDGLIHLTAVVEEAYEQLRDSLEELRSTERQDLDESIRQSAFQAGERSGFAVGFHSSGQTGTLSPRQGRQVLYIAREALNNVEKHANARQVDILLHWRDGEFSLHVRDDGRGFCPDAIENVGRYGMDIMAERSRAINGDLSIVSSPGKGTEVILGLPLSPTVVAASRGQWNLSESSS